MMKKRLSLIALLLLATHAYGSDPITEEYVVTILNGSRLSLNMKKQAADESTSTTHGVSSQIEFDYNSDELTEKSYTLLFPQGKSLESEELQGYKFLIVGHTDALGSDEYNLDLSIRRAESVKQFFVTYFAIDPARLLVKGMGETSPIASNESESGRKKNRRVEIIRID
ncbi:MAG: OmpA family protein [Thermodesulfobacteriota bacterium]